MHTEGSATIFIIIAVLIGASFTAYLAEKGNRFEAITKTQLAAEAGAASGAAAFSKVVLKESKKCILDEAEPICPGRGEAEECLNKNFKDCEPEVSACLDDAIALCQSRMDGVLAGAKTSAERAVESAARTAGAAVTSLSVGEDGSVAVKLKMKGYTPVAGEFEIEREATAKDPALEGGS